MCSNFCEHPPLERARARKCNCNTLYCDGHCRYQDISTALYELSDGYIGISYQPYHRLESHQSRRGNVSIVRIKWYHNRSDALEAERDSRRNNT